MGRGGSRISLPSPQPRVSAKLKIELNVQIRQARRGGRSLGAGLCPPHTLSGWGREERRPVSLSPKKIFLGSRVSTERAPQGQGQPQGAFAKSSVCLTPMEVSVSYLGNPRPTLSISGQCPSPLSWIPKLGLLWPRISSSLLLLWRGPPSLVPLDPSILPAQDTLPLPNQRPAAPIALGSGEASA